MQEKRKFVIMMIKVFGMVPMAKHVASMSMPVLCFLFSVECATAIRSDGGLIAHIER